MKSEVLNYFSPAKKNARATSFTFPVNSLAPREVIVHHIGVLNDLNARMPPVDYNTTSTSSLLFLRVLVSQLKNAFDNLFDGLMESKDGEKEATDVCIFMDF